MVELVELAMELGEIVHQLLVLVVFKAAAVAVVKTTMLLALATVEMVAVAN